MHDLLHERTALLAQLGTTLRNGLQTAVDLAQRFTPYAQCPALVRAMLISHTGRMLESLMQDVRLLGS